MRLQWSVAVGGTMRTCSPFLSYQSKLGRSHHVGSGWDGPGLGDTIVERFVSLAGAVTVAVTDLQYVLVLRQNATGTSGFTLSVLETRGQQSPL
jgi:hypothetical protein